MNTSEPAGTYKIGSTMNVTITADATGYTQSAITVNGKSITNFTDNSNNTYTVTYTVTEGDTDVNSSEIPTASVVLSDAAGNTNAAYTSVTKTGGDVIIDANKPDRKSVA